MPDEIRTTAFERIAEGLRDAAEGDYTVRKTTPLVSEGDEPCHGPDDRWCPVCGLGRKPGTTQRTGWPRELFVENLRHCGDEADGIFAAYLHDAADEIERLREEVNDLSEHIRIEQQGASHNATTPPVVCRICGYGPDELRQMVKPGRCHIAPQWGKSPKQCMANSDEFREEAANAST